MATWFSDIVGYGLTPLIATFVFAYGAIIGSFLNALLWRLRTGESVGKGRSYCPCCQHPLSAKDLLPILSFIMLRGKCRYCRKGIHPSYLAVEVTVGILFVLFASRAFSEPLLSEHVFAGLLRDWYAAAVLTVVFVFDFRYMLIPRSVTFPATVLLAAASILLGMSPVSLALGVLVGAGFFWLQHLVSRGKWIGGGDIPLGALMGALLGWPLILVALFLAYVVGAVVGLAMLAGKRVAWKGQIPFGTFLSAATVVTMLWGERILAWYLRMTF